MNVVTNTQHHENYISKLANGEIHLVTFADDSPASIFASALKQAFNVDRQNLRMISNQINQAQETGTLWPNAKVTGIPRKFCLEPLASNRNFRTCIRDVFIANRDYCQSRSMLFDFTGNVLNAEELEDKIHRFAMGEFNRSPLEEVEVWFDKDPSPSDCVVFDWVE